MSENKFKFEHKSIVCCEEGHKIQLLIGDSCLGSTHSCSASAAAHPSDENSVQRNCPWMLTDDFSFLNDGKKHTFLLILAEKLDLDYRMHSCTDKFDHRLLENLLDSCCLLIL